MEKVSLKLPAMYADHHVTEVRRLLLALPGVTNVYASSAFQRVDVGFDPDLIAMDQINATLGDAGYLGELPSNIEPSSASYGTGKDGHFRHTTVFEQTRQVVSFTQKVNYQGRPLWPCPGMGPIKNNPEE